MQRHPRNLLIVSGLSCIVLWVGCTNGEANSVTSELMKGMGGVNGESDFCNNPAAPCVAGEGDCDSTAHCAPGLVCEPNAGPRFGLGVSVDVCVSLTCDNNVWDANECGTDCGGTSGCGTCGNPPTKTCGGTNGTAGFCANPNARCASGEGNCSNVNQCEPGLSCVSGAGPRFGFASNIAVCLSPTCSNRTWDATECGVDCGGTSGCGTCANAPSKSCGGTNGTVGYCSNPNARCTTGEGNCSNDAQCAPGLRCTGGAGSRFGFATNIAVCLAPTCSNRTQDAGEDGVDCGGTCGSCPATGAYNWDRTFGSPVEDLVRGVAADAAGNVYAIGYFQGTVDVGGGPLVSAGGRDLLIASWASDGSFRWANRYGSTNDQLGLGIDVDSAGDIIVTGYFSGTLDFGTGVITAAGSGLQSVFLAKLSSSGAGIWAQGFGDGVNNQQGWAVAADGTNIVLTGYYRSAIDFGGGALPNASDWHVFLARFSGAGVHDWSAGYGTGAVRAHARSVAVDASGNIVIGGQFRNGAVDFGAGAITNSDPALYDGFVARFNSAGAVLWQQRFGDGSDQHVRVVDIDAAGRIVVGGYAQGTIDLGCGTLTSAGGWDAFWGQLSSSGTCNWARIAGGAGDQFLDAISVADSGTVYVGGEFEGSMGLTCGALSGGALRDGWMAGYSAAGACVWTRGLIGPGNQRLHDLDVTSSRLFVGGGFESTVNFGGGVRTSAGGLDGFVARYAN
jgi:hypothetical protein